MLRPRSLSRYRFIVPLLLLISTSAAAQDCLDYSAYPSLLGREAGTPGLVGDLAVAGDALYAVSGVNLLIFTLDDPLTPVRAQTLDLGATVRYPQVEGDRLFLAVDNDGLRIYDITTRTAPVLLNTLPRLGTLSSQQINGIAVEGDLLVYTEYAQPARLMDISDPLAPVEVGTIDETLAYPAIEGDRLVLAGSAMRLYDISDPAAAEELAALYYEGGCEWYLYSFGRPVLYQGTAYAEHKFACNWRNPYIYGDLIVPYYGLSVLSADKTATEDHPADKILGGLPARNAFRAGDQLIFADDPGYHDAYDLGDPAGPVAGYFPLAVTMNSLAGQDGLVYVGTDTGLVVADAPGAYGPEYYVGDMIGAYYLPHRLQVAGDRLLHLVTEIISVDVGGWYETYFAHQTRIWSGDTYLGRVRMPYESDYYLLAWSDLALFDGHLYTGSNTGLQVADISAISGDLMSVDVPVPDFTGLAQVGDRLYLLDRTAGLRVLSLDDPLHPADLGVQLGTYAFDGCAVLGDRLYLREGTLLRRADVSLPDAPTLLPGALIIPDGDLKISGETLFVTSTTTITWYDLTSGFPLLAGAMETALPARDVVVSGNSFYFADEMGIGLVELSTGAFIGRVMVKDATTLAVRGDELMAAQETQFDPFIVPADCADTIPVFLMLCESLRSNQGAVLRWDTGGPATRADFRVEALCDGLRLELEVLDLGGGRFQAAAPAGFRNDIIFDLYLDTGNAWSLMASRTLAPAALPAVSALASVSPNPFNPQTEISYRLREAGPAQVSVYDLTGRRLAVLADGDQAAGDHTVTWRGEDSAGRALASGSYLIRLETASGSDSRKVLLVR